jgi:hypothetical protein
MTDFKVHLAPKDDSGRERIADFVKRNGKHLPAGGKCVLNLDGSADFTWTWNHFPASFQEFVRQNFQKQLDEAIKKKDNITYIADVV